MRRDEKSFSSPAVRGTAEQLGRAIRFARLARNQTRGDFAERARVSPATMARIEGGDVAVSLSSWLSALENASLLHLLEAPANPDADPVGKFEREASSRRRASGQRKRAEDTDAYDF